MLAYTRVLFTIVSFFPSIFFAPRCTQRYPRFVRSFSVRRYIHTKPSTGIFNRGTTTTTIIDRLWQQLVDCCAYLILAAVVLWATLNALWFKGWFPQIEFLLLFCFYKLLLCVFKFHQILLTVCSLHYYSTIIFVLVEFTVRELKKIS